MKKLTPAAWLVMVMLIWAVGTPIVKGGWGGSLASPAAATISSPVRGEVVSLTTNTLSVKQAGSFMAVTIDFTIPAEAKVVRDGKACKAADIKKGDSVSVAFSTKPDGMGISVTRVEICKPAAQ